MQQRNHNSVLIIGAIVLTIAIATLGRIIPHPANATPMASLAILSGALFNKRIGLMIICISLLVSDLLLSLIYGYGMMGSWTVFTYSGFIAMALFTPDFKSGARYIRISFYTLTVTLLYWTWTNFGSWLLAGLYPHTATGLAACYVAGLPFLRDALLGNAAYMLLFLLLLLPVTRAGLLKSR